MSVLRNEIYNVVETGLNKAADSIDAALAYKPSARLTRMAGGMGAAALLLVNASPALATHTRGIDFEVPSINPGGKPEDTPSYFLSSKGYSCIGQGDGLVNGVHNKGADRGKADVGSLTETHMIEVTLQLPNGGDWKCWNTEDENPMKGINLTTMAQEKAVWRKQLLERGCKRIEGGREVRGCSRLVEMVFP